MGRQPFGLASPAALLKAAGHEVLCLDASRDPLRPGQTAGADWIAFHLPMHTATRLAVPLIKHIRAAGPTPRIACFGLYAALNADYLRSIGADTIAGGEFESALVEAVKGGPPPPELPRVPFTVPDRTGLPPLHRYATLGGRTAGYTEASRGCKHLCRHCPVVPVYQGKFRAVPADIVLADIRQQAASGATHITFGDPDFFNGPTHATRIAEALHREFPDLTWDATIKIEHLLKHRDLLPALVRTRCLFVTSAVESLDDGVLALLEKGHTRADFITAATLCRSAGLTLAPTFIPFTPWTTRAGYRDLLETIAGLDLIPNTAPVQLALRLLVTSGSRLLELDGIRRCTGPFDSAALVYPWTHADPEMDNLAGAVLRLVHASQTQGLPREQIFSRIWTLAHGAPPAVPILPSRATIPYLTEPWYC